MSNDGMGILYTEAIVRANQIQWWKVRLPISRQGVGYWEDEVEKSRHK